MMLLVAMLAETGLFDYLAVIAFEVSSCRIHFINLDRPVGYVGSDPAYGAEGCEFDSHPRTIFVLF